MVIPIDRFRPMKAHKAVTRVAPKAQPDDDPPPVSQALAA